MSDRRVRRTRAALAVAMLELVREKPWDEISVQMITDRADVARSSFYVHFDNKLALLDQSFVDAMAGISAEVFGPQFDGEDYRVLAWLVEHIAAEKAFFMTLSSSISGQIVFGRFRVAVQAMLLDELTLNGSDNSKDDVAFVLGGCFALIQDWIKSGAHKPREMLSKSLQSYARRLLR